MAADDDIHEEFPPEMYLAWWAIKAGLDPDDAMAEVLLWASKYPSHKRNLKDLSDTLLKLVKEAS